MSLECLQVAKRSLDDGYLRRSVSSSYYAAYSAVTGVLVARRVAFAHGWNNPAHEQVPDLVLHNLSLPRNTRYEINKALRRLRMERENADYRPRIEITPSTAVNSVRDALTIINLLEEQIDGN